MPRFVILEHDHPHLHWDFMLEEEGKLSTWRLPEPPGSVTSALRGERIGDHRLHYLEYEGPVSGERGKVIRWDRGEYTVEKEAPWKRLRLEGKRWRGKVEMKQVGPEWSLVFEPALQ